MLRKLAQPQLPCSIFRMTTRNLCSGTTKAVPPIVDAWAQLPTERFIQAVPEVARLLQQSHSPAQKMMEAKVGPQEIMKFLDHVGVAKVLLSAWMRPGKIALSNEEIKEYTTAFPDRFIGIGTADLEHPMKATAEIEKCVKEYGFKGIRILPWLWNKPPTTNLFYPIFAKCVELDVPFCTQAGHTGPLCPSEPGRPVPYIDQVALDFPELKIVCGHIGYPWTDEMIGVAWKHPNVYIDTSAHAPKYYPPQLIQFMNSYGASKVMFGTNFPQLTWDKCCPQAAKLPLKPEAMDNFLWKNADRVFKLGMADVDTKSKL